MEADAERVENEVTTREQREQETGSQLEDAQHRAARRPVLQAESLHAAALVEQLSRPSPAMDEYAERILDIRTAVQEKRDAAASMVKEILELEASQRELGLLEREVSRIQADIDRQEEQAAERERRVVELRARADRLPELESKAAKARNLVEQLTAPSAEMDDLRARSQALQVRVHFLREENGSLRREMEDLRAKKDMLEASATPEGGGASCPLCGTALAEDGCRHLAASYESQGRSLADRFRANEAEAHNCGPGT